MSHTYIGRFAPSPSGPLHAGSLVAALASYLDARAQAGQWLLRIEDVDVPRTVAGADRIIMDQLVALGLRWDWEVVWQSQRDVRYDAACDRLRAAGRLYGCGCTRREIADAAREAGVPADVHELPYMGTCRSGVPAGREARAWRVCVPEGVESFDDRWLGPQAQDVAREVGDFAIRRADGLWAYQLAVVVDDALQGVNAVVRGADLLSSTARQRVLARLLGYTPPQRHARSLDPGPGYRLEVVEAESCHRPRYPQALASAECGVASPGFQRHCHWRRERFSEPRYRSLGFAVRLIDARRPGASLRSGRLNKVQSRAAPATCRTVCTCVG